MTSTRLTTASVSNGSRCISLPLRDDDRLSSPPQDMNEDNNQYVIYQTACVEQVNLTMSGPLDFEGEQSMEQLPA